MDPRPRRIPLSKDNYQFDWLQQAHESYAPVYGRNYTETSFFRGNVTIDILDSLLPEFPEKPTILLVGLGRNADSIMCTYVPFKIAAHLQASGKDYGMTLVDVDPDVIEDVRNRTRIYVDYHEHKPRVREKLEVSWNKFLSDTQQSGREVFEPEDELIFAAYLAENFGWRESARTRLEKGIASADVPVQFRDKLQSGEIQLIHDDIAVVNIADSGPFDFVEIINMLYLLPPTGQQLALANIARSVKVGGYIFMNDLYTRRGYPVFTQLGGWLDDGKLRQLGLEIVHEIAGNVRSRAVLLKKVN